MNALDAGEKNIIKIESNLFQYEILFIRDFYFCTTFDFKFYFRLFCMQKGHRKRWP